MEKIELKCDSCGAEYWRELSAVDLATLLKEPGVCDIAFPCRHCGRWTAVYRRSKEQVVRLLEL